MHTYPQPGPSSFPPCLLPPAAPSQHTPVPPLSPSQISTLRNANHISNAIHSSPRQWGSSLSYNGMSFLVSVPHGTQLCHGAY